MQLLCDSYSKNYADELDAELVYSHTEPGSKLRLFIAELIRSEGPFSSKVAHELGDEYSDKWVKLLSKGGDLISDVIAHGFNKYNTSSSPWKNKNIQEHYEDVIPRCSAESWHNEKVLVDRARCEGIMEKEEKEEDGQSRN
jgi:hypothetical protein